MSDKIGSLTRGNLADLLLLKSRGGDPYAALVHATPLGIRLVNVGGKPVYGDRDLMEKFVPPDALEPVSLCNKPDAKVLYLGSDASAPPLKKTWKETTADLNHALQQWRIKLADLAEDSDCKQGRPAKSLRGETLNWPDGPLLVGVETNRYLSQRAIDRCLFYVALVLCVGATRIMNSRQDS